MSVPFTILFCDKCDAKWSSLMLNGYFIYVLPDGRHVHANRCEGWCNRCSDVVPVELLANKDDVVSSLNEAETTISRIQATFPTTLATRLLWKIQKTKRNKIQREITVRQGERDKIAVKLNFLTQRTDPEKCLRCGSMDILHYSNLPKFTQTESRSLTPPKKPTVYQHPNCGGTLCITTSGGLQVAAYQSTYLYDVNGNMTHTLPDGEYIDPYSGEQVRINTR
jgi:ferredoxin